MLNKKFTEYRFAGKDSTLIRGGEVSPSEVDPSTESADIVNAALSDVTETFQNIDRLADLVDNSIKKLGGLPLTTIVHGWGGDSAKEFINALTPSIREIDSFILIPSQARGTAPAPPNLPRTVVLNLGKRSHLWTYKKSIADIVFFPAVEDDESEATASFNRRAHTIVVDERGNNVEKVKKVACDIAGNTYLWAGGLALELCRKPNENSLAPSSSTGEDHELDKIGKLLAGLAASLEQLHEQTGLHLICTPEPQRRSPRPIFKSILRQVLMETREQESLSRELVFQADKHSWPDWSVQCLPDFYIPLETLPSGHRKALVWRHILDCLPEDNYNTIRTLCSEQFLEVEMPSNADSIVEKVVQIFKETVQSSECRTERAFLGEVHHAMVRINDELNLSTTGQRTEVMSKAYAVGA